MKKSVDLNSMRRSVVLIALICGCLAGFSQRAKVNEANGYLAIKNYKQAITLIDIAVANAETKNDADAWYVRGMAYLQKALDTTVSGTEASAESYRSLMKALTIKPDFSSEIDNSLYTQALVTFNVGVADYGSKDFSSAYTQFMKIPTLYNAGGGKRFLNNKEFTDLVVSAKTNAAYAALAATKDNDALALFTELKKTSGKNDPIVYQSIIEINQRLNKGDAALATITEARNLFPKEELFRNLEINYYISSGKQDVLLGKLEDAVKADPKNSELLFNLGNVYEHAAFPKNAEGMPMASPANFKELFAKAETTYQDAIVANPANADYHYNFAVIYYEFATEITKQMNGIKGTTPEENKRYDALLAQRNALFAQALPHFEKAYSLLDGHSSSLTADEKVTYRNTMVGLREIYTRNNNKVKTDELKAKLAALSN